MKKKSTHKEVINFIKVIRESFGDSSIIYKWGGCYGFYTILKHLFPEAVAYFSDEDHDHILSKINGRYYDIDGEYDTEYHDFKESKAKKLTVRNHEIWSAKASGQRMEYMLAKYNRMCKKHAEVI